MSQGPGTQPSGVASEATRGQSSADVSPGQPVLRLGEGAECDPALWRRKPRSTGSSGTPKISEAGWGPAPLNSQAGASALWARRSAQGLGLHLDPLSTESIARGPDPHLDLGQTQMGATSEAFPPCLMDQPPPAISKTWLAVLWFEEASPSHVHRGSWKVPVISECGKAQQLCLTSLDPGKTGGREISVSHDPADCYQN